jgi:hypothetical protein
MTNFPSDSDMPPDTGLTFTSGYLDSHNIAAASGSPVIPLITFTWMEQPSPGLCCARIATDASNSATRKRSLIWLLRIADHFQWTGRRAVETGAAVKSAGAVLFTA